MPPEKLLSEMSRQARRTLVRDATARPTTASKELQNSMAEMRGSMYEPAMSQSLHYASLAEWKTPLSAPMEFTAMYLSDLQNLKKTRMEQSA